MKFPLKTIRVGFCLFIASSKGAREGKAINPDDYIKRKWKGEMWSIHRLSFNLNVKRIPRWPRNRKRGFVLHKCDKKSCIEPSHLYLGTQSQNMFDTASRNISFINAMQRRKGIKRHPSIGRKISEAKKGQKPSKATSAAHWKNDPKMKLSVAKKISETLKRRQ